MASNWQKSYYRYKSYFLNVYNLYKQRPDLRIYLELLLSIGTISFFLAVALRPTALTIIQLLDQIKAKKETVSQLDTKIQNIQKAQTVYEQEQGRLVLLDTSIPSDPTPETFVRQLEGLANNTSTNILGMTMGETVLVGSSIEPIKKAKDLKAFPDNSGDITFSISVTGDYSNLDSFFKNLENMRRPVKVDAVTVNVNSTDQGKQIVLVVSGRIPFLNNNSQ
jgi:hypothetical protein